MVILLRIVEVLAVLATFITSVKVISQFATQAWALVLRYWQARGIASRFARA